MKKLLVLLTLLTACNSESPMDEPEGRPDLIATNAFYYYADVEVAWGFYRDTLGLETVVDYGFAKIMRLAGSSYLTLVQADSGMHTAEEPKTVTLNLVTDTLEPWNEHLVANNVAMQVDYQPVEGESSNSFVAIDPEGYFLRFVRYNPHPNHDDYVAAFAESMPLPALGNEQLSIRATSLAAYFNDVNSVSTFYEELFGISVAGTLMGESVYQIAGSGFLTLVDGADDLHQPTEENGVTFSFLTTDVDSWFKRASGWPGFELRTPEIFDEGGGLVRVFVGYDPTGIFLEWDTFMDAEANAALIRHLQN